MVTCSSPPQRLRLITALRIVASTLLCHLTLSSDTSSVTELTSSNFEEHVLKASGGPWFVKFYAPWCGHCKNLVPTWESLADELKGEVSVAKVDAVAERELAKTYGVSSYPHLLLIIDGRTYNYEGDRSLAALSAFAKGGYGAVEKVTILTNENFNSSITDGLWFIKFYSPHCGHCKQLAPTWGLLAAQLEGEVNVAKVDATVETQLAERFDVDGYPLLKLLADGQEYTYSGDRSLDNLEAFAKGGYLVDKLLPQLSRDVTQLTDATFDSSVRGSAQPWFIKFHAPWCQHCKTMAPDWGRLATKLKGTVHIAELDAIAESEVADAWHIKSFPTLLLIRGDTVYSYPGLRKADAMEEFVSAGYSSHEAVPIPRFLESHVVRLTADNFYSAIRSRNVEPWFINFYLASCGHCKTLAPIWEAMAKNLSGKVKVAKLNCEKDRELAETWGIERFPTLKLIAGNAVFVYNGAREQTAMQAFADGGYKDAKPEGHLPEPEPPSRSGIGRLFWPFALGCAFTGVGAAVFMRFSPQPKDATDAVASKKAQ